MKKRYGAIDGLRTYACIGIVMMHVLGNGNYDIPGFVGKSMIPSFTNFVFLFMVVSAFGLCCGYFERFKDGSINIESFYRKRFLKILPFFALLSIIDVIISPSKENLMELFANITLIFGLLPNADISVIGVGWFLGVIFVFYLLFPFFTVLLKTKSRAWIAFAIAVIYNVLCSIYFMDKNHVLEGFVRRTNIVYCFMFFLAGGLAYLYQERIKKVNVWVNTGLTIGLVGIYYILGGNIFACLLVSIALLTIAITASKESILLGGYWKTDLQPSLVA